MTITRTPYEQLLARVVDALPAGDRERVEQAFEVAARAHGTERPAKETRDEGTPPISHPVRVMYSLLAEQDVRDPDMLITALLHDVLEVSALTLDDIRSRFGPTVAGWVDLLTRKPGVSREKYALQIKEAPFEVFLIEMAARLDNLRTAHLRKKSLQPYFNETRRYYLLFAEQRAHQYPALKKYTDAMRMIMEGD